MTTTNPTDDDQAALWNGIAGRAWVDVQEVLDQTLRPFEDLLVEAVSGGRVLDVGCGTGTTTLAVARRQGAQGHSLGVDISAPMIAAAQARAAAERSRASFVCADAQTHAFAPASFDAILSRFGVMFFADPVAAFANLRRAGRSGAALRFFAWRSAADNPFMTTAERAAAPLLPAFPPRQPDAPGQFAFADAARVERILAESGWADIEIRPAPLRGVQVPERLVPLAIDEFPAFFIAAACAEGETLVTGAEELRVKESDRIAVMARGLDAVGVRTEVLPDGLRIVGGPIGGGTVDSHGDHRIAMSFAVASLRAAAPIEILDVANVATSFPGFADLARAAGLKLHERP